MVEGSGFAIAALLDPRTAPGARSSQLRCSKGARAWLRPLVAASLGLLAACGSTNTPHATTERDLTLQPGAGGTLVATPSGTACAGCATGTAQFDDGTSVTLVATPDQAHTFTAFTGDCSGTACSLVMNENHLVGATFAPVTAAIDVVRIGPGVVTSTPESLYCGAICTASFDQGSMVTLSAIPDSGASFAGWGGECSGMGECTLEVDGAKHVTAAFVSSTASSLDTALTNGPSNPTRDPTATFWFTGSAAAASFQCSLDGATPAACTSPATYSLLADGAHTFAVAAVDADGQADPTPATYAWTVDTLWPQTTITSHPSDPSNDTSPALAFDSSEAGSTFVCRLDEAPPASCTSPHLATGLVDGVHTFTVLAIDAAGNEDQSPPSYSWTVDTAPPTASITFAPTDPSNVAAPSFSFTSTKSGTFACALDGALAAPCTSPTAYDGLTNGAHTFSVVATDLAGNASAAAVYSWTVDLALPTATITAQPANPTSQTSASFSFTSTKTGSTFACSLDGAASSACASPDALDGLASGAHTFSVVATDPAGNSSAPARDTWTIDTTAPVATLTAQPATPTNQTSASFSFTSTKTSITFACTLDGAQAACASPKTYTGLSPGSHTFSLVATDPAGNHSAAVGATWTIDTARPVATITATPTNPSHVVTPSFSFISSKDGSTFSCQLDTRPAAACTSPMQYIGMSDGSHTFHVTAIDPAGNASIAASYTWVVNTAPLVPPTPIAATANDGQITVTWTAVDGAVSYQVYYGTTPALGSTTGPLTGTSTTLYGLTNCSTYYVTVTDTDPSGNECGQPTPVTATPGPPAPTVTAAGANGSIAVSWPSVPQASSYKVYYGTVAGGPYTGTAALNGSSPLDASTTTCVQQNPWTFACSLSVDGLPPYDPAYLTVSTVEGSCEGPMSAESISAPIPWRSLNPAPTDKTLQAISCAGSRPCVALGVAGTALLSTDGTSWSSEYSGTTVDFNTVQMTSASVGYALMFSQYWGRSAIYKTTNGGAAWIATPDLPQFTYSFSFADTSTGLGAAASGDVVKTTDGANTWTVLNTGTLANWYGIYLAPDATLAIAVGQQGIIRRSTDGGDTWANAPSGTTHDLLAVTCSSASHCWAVGNAGVIVASVDGGATWTLESSGTTGTLRRVGFASNTVGWVVGDSGFIGATTSGGATWAAQTSNETGTLWGLAVIDATHAYVVGDNGILRHTTDGATWGSQRIVLTTQQLNRVHAFSTTHLLIIGNGGNVLLSSDGGMTWSTSNPTTQDLLDLWFIDDNTGWAVGRGGTILKTVNGGVAWQAEDSGVTDDVNAIQCIDSQTCWAAAGTKVLATTNGGANWTATDLSSATQGQTILSLNFTDATHGILGLAGGSRSAGDFLRTIDGIFWESTQVNGSGPVTLIYRADASNLFLVVNPGEGGYLMHSGDDGVSWEGEPGAVGYIYGVYPSDIAFKHGVWAVSSTFYWEGGGTPVETSTDGHTWEAVPTGFTESLYGIDIGDAVTFYTVGDQGTILKTVTAGR